MNITITTRALPATDTEPSRIKVRSQSGAGFTQPMPPGTDVDVAHEAAARKLAVILIAEGADLVVQQVRETATGYEYRAFKNTEEPQA